MRESTVWNYVRGGLAPYGCHLTRIENIAGNGIPDVSIGMPGKSVWVELKYIKEWPKRESTKVKLPLRAEQALWFKARGSLSGEVWSLSRIGDDFFLLEWQVSLKAYEEGYTRAEWHAVASLCWTRRIDFLELYNYLS